MGAIVSILCWQEAYSWSSEDLTLKGKAWYLKKAPCSYGCVTETSVPPLRICRLVSVTSYM